MTSSPSSPEATNHPDDTWLRDVYRPDAPQLTVRAVISGAIVDMRTALSNVYVVLKTGFRFLTTPHLPCG